MIPFYTEKAEKARVKARELGEWLKSRPVESSARHGLSEDILAALWERGYYGYLVPEEQGGSGGGLYEACLILEEFSPVSSSVSLSLLVQYLGVLLFLQDTDPERRCHRLGRLINERRVLAFALSEPFFGKSETHAERSEDGFKLSGRKVYVNQAEEADWILVMAESGSGPGIFLVEKGTAGMMVSRNFPRAAARELSWTEIRFEQVKVPADSLVGELGAGEELCETALSRTGVLVAASALGLIEAEMQALEQNPGRVPSGRIWGLEKLCATAGVELEAGRALCFQAAYGLDKNLAGCLRLSLASKIFNTELARRFLYALAEMAGSEGVALDQELKQRLEFACLLGSLLGSNSFLLENFFNLTNVNLSDD
jgi:alkylation response protein AidB-like acyl-CoA dehydrogenase